MKPLGALEATVESYGPGQKPQQLTETGPREIRTVARALNRMQERITRLVDDRTRTLPQLAMTCAHRSRACACARKCWTTASRSRA